MTNNIFRHAFIILLINSVILLSAGCGSSSGNGTSEKSVSNNSGTVQSTTQNEAAASDYEPTATIELSDYLLNNIALVHDELGGERYDSSNATTYAVTEPGDIVVTYANKADQGLDVLNMCMAYSGDHRAGNSAYRLFGCALGDTSTDVHYRLMDYGFQTTYSDDVWEYLSLYDGEWTLSYKCDNGFLSEMTVDCTKRTMSQALQSGLESGYFVAALTGHSTDYAYIDKISVADNNVSIAFSGVFEKGSSADSERQMTEYMTFTVFPDENTAYIGSGESSTYYSEEEFINIMKSFNGLGLALTVDNGTLVKAVLMS